MEQKDYRLAAIMYTDISGFSRMMERDESGTLQLLRYHNELISEIVVRHHGTVIKTIGDALLVDFKNTVEALQSALEIQDKLYAHNKENPGLPLLVRIGVHLGDIYFFENDALGEGINIAARLQSLAQPGCICFSQDVYNLVLNKIEFRAEKLGKVSLKNITKEIHAYEITSPNIEFDPEHGKPRPGFKPGSYLNDGEEPELPVGGVASSTGPGSSMAQKGQGGKAAEVKSPPVAETAAAPAPEKATAASPASAKPEPDRDYSEEGSRNVLSEIRKAILQDTKTLGRRMTVDEALDRYAYFGVEAQEVIATMSEQGLLVKAPRPPRPPSPGASSMRFGLFGEGTGDPSKPMGSFDAQAFGRNIEAAVSGIVGEIERNVQRSLDKKDGEDYAGKYSEYAGRHAERFRRRMERYAVRETVKRDSLDLETSKWDKKVFEDEAWKPGSEELSRDFQAYRKGLEDRCRRQRGGFVGNLTSFLAVNGLLWFLNLSTSAGFLWAAIVSAAWGIGVVSSAVAAYRATTKLREIEAMPELDGEQLEDYKKLNRVKDSISLHAATAVMVPILLGIINFLTGPQFLWFLIPSGAILVSWFSHLLSYGIAKPRLEKKLLASLGVKGGWKNIFRSGKIRREEEAGLGPYAELYREAVKAKEAVEGQWKEGPGSQADGDLSPTLNEYLGQVRLLAQSANEIDRIVEAMPMAELTKDKASLVSREGAATSDSLRTEYRRSIGEIEKQEKAYQELKDQSEVIQLRLGSSVNQLKQMRLDIARVKSAPGTDGSLGTGLDQLKRRTDEMAHYLEDLRKGYDESRRDPFAELEEAEKEAEAKKKALTEGSGGEGSEAPKA